MSVTGPSNTTNTADTSIHELAKKACPECLPPPEIARKVETTAVNKANLNTLNTTLLGILAGAFIGLGAMLYTLVTTQSGLGFGLNRLIGGLTFCLGLILVVLSGAELFTGNTLIVTAWLNGRVGTDRMFKNWGIVYFANLVGALGLVAIAYVSQQWSFNNSLVGANAVSIANTKVNIAFWPALARGVLCNALVCLAIWMCFGGKTVTDKILAIIFPITAFVAGGFEHSIANMYFIPIGILLAHQPSVLQAAGLTAADVANLNFVGLINNLIPVTIGNIIGGSIMVGGVYWMVYLRHDNVKLSLTIQHWLTRALPRRRHVPTPPVHRTLAAPAGPEPASTSTGKALTELLATAILARAAGDRSFFETLTKSPETVLKDYNLSEDERAALSSGDITWLEKSIASLPNPMTTYAVLKRYSVNTPAKN